MSKSFLDGVKTPFAGLVKSYEITDKDGVKKELGYLPWPRALALAGRPTQQVMYWTGYPYFELFGGVVVAVSQVIERPDNAAPLLQNTYLPVLNGANQPITIARIDPRDISDTINRCRAKSAAMVSGVGLSMYSNGNVDTIKFLRSLNVKPETDLSTIEPLIVKKAGKGDYIDWPSALAAARITDPSFEWDVGWHKVADDKTGELVELPALRLGNGWGVTVKVTYRGKTHTEMLPIMGQVLVATKHGDKKLDHQPLLNPTCHDWNRAVMRCLVKAIAIETGYGLSVYANEPLVSLHVDPVQRKPEPQPPAAAPAMVVTPDDPEVHASLVPQVEAAMLARSKKLPDMLVWLGNTTAQSVKELSVDELERSLSALVSNRRTQEPHVTH